MKALFESSTIDQISIDMDNARDLLLELEAIEAEYALATSNNEKAALETEHLSISQDIDATMTNIRLAQQTASDELENGAAGLEVNALATPHDLAYNQKAISSLQLKQWAGGSTTLSSSDIADLTLIAYQCPLEGGNAVYRARALLKTTGTYTFEHVECSTQQQIQTMPTDLTTATNTKLSSLEIEKQDELQYYRIYPNPTHTSFSILGTTDTDFDKVQLYSLTGQLLQEWNISSNYSNLQLPANLVDGIYWIKLMENDGTISYQKLVIAQ